MKNYRFGFALTTALGNKTRYLNLRKYADRDPEVECVWAAISHSIEPDPYMKLPTPLHTQKVLDHEARPVLEQWNQLDAVMIHAFQFYAATVLRKNFKRHKPLLVLSQDYAPIADPEFLENYGHRNGRDLKRKLRYLAEVWFTRRADLYLPYTKWAGENLIHDCGVSEDQVEVIPIGVDLDIWPYAPPVMKPDKVNILFVGGQFSRKGGNLLLSVFQKHFADKAILHLVTKEPPPDLPASVQTYTNLNPNDGELQKIFAKADVFVLPTRADMSPFVIIEAMATGKPVIATEIADVPNVVRHNETGFLISVDDEEMLRQRLQELLQNPEKRLAMGKRGREIVEAELNAEVGAKRVLAAMKNRVDAKRRQHF